MTPRPPVASSDPIRSPPPPLSDGLCPNQVHGTFVQKTSLAPAHCFICTQVLRIREKTGGGFVKMVKRGRRNPI